VIPPWEKAERPGDLIITPGAGFGTGTHDTTRLCLQLVGEIRDRLQGVRVLDFGSGSGILSIAAAKSGAIVEAVEIDELAIENARENARLNGCEDRIHFHTRIPESPETYDWVIANILKNVLLKFADPLCARTGKGMVLSGLLEEDLAPVLMRFSQELKPARPPRILRSETEYGLVTDGERWRALVFFTAR
jgi:ribosomal protein L11 methyltransferase